MRVPHLPAHTDADALPEGMRISRRDEKVVRVVRASDGAAIIFPLRDEHPDDWSDDAIADCITEAFEDSDDEARREREMDPPKEATDWRDSAPIEYTIEHEGSW